MVGGVLSWYNQISYPHIKYVIPQEWDFWAPCQAPQLRGLIRRKMPQSIWFWSPEGLDYRSSTVLGGNRDPSLGGCTQVLVCTGTQGKKSDFLCSWAKGICWSWRCSREVGLGERAAAHHRDKVTGGKGIFREYSWDLLEFDILASRPDPTEQLINSSAGMPQAK